MIWQFVTQAASTQSVCMAMYNIVLVFRGIKDICFQSDVIENCLLEFLGIYSLEQYEA